jgi:hypothetical protein
MNKTHKSIFDNFNELSANVVNEDFDKAKEFLAELEIDVDTLGTIGENEFKKTMFLAGAKAHQSHDLSLIAKLKEKIKESLERNATLVDEILKNTLLERKASFQFRNLEKWSDDELREVLGDIDLSKLLEDLEDMED